MTVLQRALASWTERRKIERRVPLATLSPADAAQLILDLRYTGPVTVNYASGVAKEMSFPADPMRIVLDKTPGGPDIESGIK